MQKSKTIHRYDIISNATVTCCGLLRFVALLSILLTGVPAQAATEYEFPLAGQLPAGKLPAGCSRDDLPSTTSYTCGALTLADGDTITVGLLTTPVTVTFTGAFTTVAGNLINAQGTTSDLNIVTNGVLTLGADTILNANVTGTAAINLGARSSIGGNITASTTTGVVTLGATSTVGGFIHTDLGAVNVADSSVVGGDITTEAGVVTLSPSVSVGGGIDTIAGGVTVGGSSIISGDITTEAGVVTLSPGVSVGGGIETIAGGVTVGGSSIIGGDITTEAGVVTLLTNVSVGGGIETIAGGITVGDGSSIVGGSITTEAGVVTLLTNVSVGGDIETIAGGITVGDRSSICGSVITTGAGVVTITTNVQIGGDIRSVPGAITVGSQSTVAGNIIVTGAGVVTSTNNLIGGNISTIAGAITLTDSRVGGSVAASGAGVVTITNSVTNDTTLVVPVSASCSVAAPAFNHFQIEHDGQGLTCASENFTVKVCADTTCSTLYADAIDVKLSINGILDQTVTVVGGSTVANFSYINKGTATLSIDQTYECKNGDSTSCELIFTDAGFRFLYGAAETTSIGNQTSGNNFADIIKLQAVENVNGVCTGLFRGNIDIELSQQNIAPSVTTGLNFKVNGTSGTSIDKYPTYTPIITLDFGAKSKATIPMPVYLDAGKIRLYAKYNVGSVSLVGESNDFWVSPEKLVVTATASGSAIIGNSSSSAIKHKAGQLFDFTVTAYNALGTSPANITANYIPNDIQLLLARTGPTAGGVNGTFNYGNGIISSSLTPNYQSVTLSSFNLGVSSTHSASYAEVGLLTLDLQDFDYGFSGNIITTDSLNIGRFTPDYFEQTVVEQGALFAVCNQNTTFAYTGQVMVSDSAKGAISYLANPVVELTAKNVQGVTVQNYTEPGYNKFTPAANFIIRPTTDTTILGKDTNFLPLTANLFAGTFSFGLPLEAGILHYELNGGDNFFYPRNENSEVIAQDNDIDFLIDQDNFVDGDGIGITNPEDITSTTSVNLRFGRALIENSFGPETANFPQKLSTEYLNASGRYVVNEQDSCTLYNASNIILNSGTLDKNLASVNTATGQLEKGETRAITLTAPGAGHQGTINIEYDIYSWLKYDWNWNGVDTKSFDANPTATATFGLFRGNDRITYQGEVFD
ncbi:hypothetical protein H4J46_13490 [Colwellia sp. MB02u-6]|uniref:DUF6701 domain-containing protein n=1 Tax=Colwellia sp. MB02u-6 TaxID=2759824 RepID=UPI0015F65A2A|nr:DUF6701 domain-containing protein [Colwellia sp. MB02u-6]MBA6328934.1 hypothetical protein [Colwellia sp. MB02u-6]